MDLFGFWAPLFGPHWPQAPYWPLLAPTGASWVCLAVALVLRSDEAPPASTAQSILSVNVRGPLEGLMGERGVVKTQKLDVFDLILRPSGLPRGPEGGL
jgi:hypothetical protein